MAQLMMTTMSTETHLSASNILVETVAAVSETGALPDSTVNGVWFLQIVDQIGIQLSALNTKHITAISSHDLASLDTTAQQCLLDIFDQVTGMTSPIIAQDSSHASRHFIGPAETFLEVPNSTLEEDPAGSHLPYIFTRGEVPSGPSPKSKPRVPRPPNAWIIYRSERHRTVIDVHPNIANKQISQILAQQWHAEPPHVRAEYKARADAIKAQLLRNCPGYIYNPRKSTEIKRRAKKNRTGAASAQTSELPLAQSKKTVLLRNGKRGPAISTWAENLGLSPPLTDL